jgi:Phosphotransferase enzyme family
VPAEAELLDVLEGTLGPVARLERRTHPYRTSFPLEELRVELADGRALDLVLKDLSRELLSAPVRRAKPAFLHDPRREVETYRCILAPAGLGTARLYGADGSWIAIEKVHGAELWQVGDLHIWRAVARRLAALHRRLTAGAAEPYLLRYDAEWYRMWLDRARAVTGGLEAVIRIHEDAVERLLALPTTVIHGELYASNVLVSGSRVCIVDWETAALGPGLIDVAALTTGWGDDKRAAIAEAYGNVSADDLDCCRLHLAVRWLGWSRDWNPPPEHRRDWLREALDIAARLER